MARRLIVLAENRNLVHLAVGLSLGAAFVHMLVIPEHLREWRGYGLFFAVAMLAQGLYGILLIALRSQVVKPHRNASSAHQYVRAVYILGILGNAALIGLYLVTRTVGIPFFGPGAGVTEEVTSLSLLSQGIEAALIAVLVALIYQTRLKAVGNGNLPGGNHEESKGAQITPKRIWLWLEDLLGVSSRQARAGLVLMIVGTAVTVLYHLALFAPGVSSQLKSDLVAYGVHTLTFLGMLVFLASVLYQEQPKSGDVSRAQYVPRLPRFNLDPASVDSRAPGEENNPNL